MNGAIGGIVGGLAVIVSDALPTHPSDGDDAARMVRHGLADVLAWLGEDVGPRPGEPTHVYYGDLGGPVLVCSRKHMELLLASIELARP